jgi:hypothetical protein
MRPTGQGGVLLPAASASMSLMERSAFEHSVRDGIAALEALGRARRDLRVDGPWDAARHGMARTGGPTRRHGTRRGSRESIGRTGLSSSVPAELRVNVNMSVLAVARQSKTNW